MLRRQPAGINPVQTAFGSAPPPTKAEETRRFVESANRLGTHVQWWEVPGGVRLKLFDFAQGDAHVRADHGPALDDAAASPRPRHGGACGSSATPTRSSKNEKTLAWLSLKRAQRVWDQLARRKAQEPDPRHERPRRDGRRCRHLAGRHEPRRSRPVPHGQVLLMSMTIMRELEEQKARLKARGFGSSVGQTGPLGATRILPLRSPCCARASAAPISSIG